MSQHILIAEDEPKIAALLQDYLVAAGMTASIVDDGAAVIAAVAERAPDLLLLDVMLPNRDGMSLCRELHATRSLPIIMLTARVEEIDRLLGLELGADDYICKPFSPREVVARVKAVLRRAPGGDGGDGGTAVTTPDAAARACLAIDPARMRVSVDGQRVELTRVEFQLLATLAAHPGRVYRRDELLDLIYDDFRDVSDRTIDSHVKNVRRKLEQAAPGRTLIHSVYGVGYKLEYD
ncbi:MAG: response regulator [Gammaproteobacteria bacterium]|nr:response regulator [Gammaproteobacteria bacterium]